MCPVRTIDDSTSRLELSTTAHAESAFENVLFDECTRVPSQRYTAGNTHAGNNCDRFQPPAQSRADRNVPAASTAHCTAMAILGEGHGTRVQAESHLELFHLLLLNANSRIGFLHEQAQFRFGPRKERSHIFDVVANLRDGARIAFTVKPMVRLVSGRFLKEMQEVAYWVQKSRFASEVRLQTEQHIHPIDLHNAKIFAAVREPDAQADNAAVAHVANLIGARPIHEWSGEIGLDERGYRSVLQLLRKGTLALAQQKKSHLGHSSLERKLTYERRL